MYYNLNLNVGKFKMRDLLMLTTRGGLGCMAKGSGDGERIRKLLSLLEPQKRDDQGCGSTSSCPSSVEPVNHQGRHKLGWPTRAMSPTHQNISGPKSFIYLGPKPLLWAHFTLP